MEYMRKYVGYYRVSTVRQGQSGLGLESQEAIVGSYVCSVGGDLVSGFTDVESGRRGDRPGLRDALLAVRGCGGVLVIARMDRLARNAAFLMSLLDSGVEFVACDLPGANRLTVVIMAEIAQQEAEAISMRTRAALAAKRARGEVLGRVGNFTVEGRLAGSAAVRAKARVDVNNMRASGYARVLRGQGMSLGAIASRLNSEGFVTSRGGCFGAMAVSRVLSMYS